MSVRTILEINHDYMQQLLDTPDDWRALLMILRSGAVPSIKDPGDVGLPGIRILGQRHHSETLKLTVK